MHTFKSYSKMWFLALLLVVFVAGCGKDHPAAAPGGSKDTTKPTVSSTIPIKFATGVAINTSINVIFSEVMSSATITNTTLVVTEGSTTVPGTVSYVGKTANFKPTSNLLSSTTYTATVTTGVKDLAGNALAVNKVWSFTTGTTTDSTPPFVSSTSPTNGAIGVKLNSSISAIFNEAMSAATATAGSFTLMNGSTPVAGELSYLGRTATFNPTSNLASNTTYTATITTGVTDLAGNALAAAKVWSFTTGTETLAGPAPVLLGAAEDYAILAATGVDTTGVTAVVGDIGVSPYSHTALTGWALVGDETTDAFFTSIYAPGYKLYAADNIPPTPSDLGVAVLNMQAAYTDAAGRTATSAATTNVGAGTLTDLTLTAGVYEWGSALTIPTNLTLSGSATDVWIFKVAGTLTMAANKSIIMVGALPQNVFWQVSESVTIGAGSHFEGIILGQTLIAFQTGSSINGRLLAQAAVTIDATAVTQPAP